MTRAFAEYMVFVDESGSPGMGNIDPHYPLFVLVFFIVKKSDYTTQIAPALQQFKFQHFGHDQLILHEREIRKDLGDFAFLKTPALKDAFLGELTTLIEAAPFDLVCVVIDKARHKAQYKTPADPYHLALGFGLERVCGLLAQRSVWHSGPAKAGALRANPAVHVVVEKRGKSEDDDLELEFRRICDGVGGASTGRLGGTAYRHVGVEAGSAQPRVRSGETQIPAEERALHGLGAEVLPLTRSSRFRRSYAKSRRQKTKGPGIRRSQLSTENPQSFAGSLVGFAAEREGNSWRFCCRRRLKTWSQADGFLDRRRVGSTHVYSLRPKAWYGLSIRRSVADFEKMSKRINELRLSLLSTC